jgi:hypothetical protein
VVAATVVVLEPEVELSLEHPAAKTPTVMVRAISMFRGTLRRREIIH